MRANKKFVFKISFLFLAAFLFAVAYFIPYCHDDWDWGLPIGISQLLHATINSRYTGNLIVVLLTRSELLKTLVMGLFFLCMPLFAIYICTGKKPDFSFPLIILAFLSYALHLGLPADMWGQTNGWVSGFANYSFSTVLLCLFIKFAYDLFDKNESCHSWIKVFLYFFVTLNLQLFLENITVYIAAVSICIFIAHCIYRRKPSACAAALLLGALLGTLIMFSSNIYPTLVKTGQAVDNVRLIIVDMNSGFVSLVYQIVYNYIALILPELYKGYWASSLILLIILFFLAYKNRASLPKALFAAVQAANILLILYYLGQAIDIDYLLCGGNTRYMAMLRLISSLGFFILVSAEIFLFEKNIKRKLFSLAIWVSAPAVMLPLSVVNGIGPRSFYTSTFFILLLIIIAADKLFSQLGKPGIRTAAIFCSAIFFAACLRLACVYYNIGQVKIQRDMIISAARDSSVSEIVLPEYEQNTNFLWFPTPYEYHRVCYFKDFYEIDSSVNIIFEKNDPTS